MPRVQKPGRYLGTEFNAVRKGWDRVAVRMAFVFPDLYEIGMSHLGLTILYGLVNEHEDCLLERAFAPAPDMEAEMRRRGLPLFSLESYRPLTDFDIVGFTLQYELTYSNVLNLLDLAGLPLLASERGEEHPLVVGGGPCAVNPEPLAPFFDALVLGEGEEVLPEILALLKEVRRADRAGEDGSPRWKVPRRELLKRLAGLEGVYVPSFYRVRYLADGRVAAVEPLEEGVPERVRRRVVADLDRAYFPRRPIVPFLEVVHDRAMLEIMRGCTRGCRFCQAGIMYRPVRERSLGTLRRQAEELLRATGHQEVGLVSLSSADYTAVEALARGLVEAYGRRGIGISLPSLRADAFSVGLAEEIERVRKTGLTFAPEAGTDRLRAVINKQVTEEDLLAACRAAFAAGWRRVKLYFMIGLPTETQEDLDGLAELTYRVLRLGEAERPGAGRPEVSVSVASFVPKPHTPFQWEPQDTQEALREKQAYLGRRLRHRRIRYSWHDPEQSLLEAVLARGDRRLAAAVTAAWRAGARFDGWEEHFSWSRWEEAIRGAGLDPSFYAHRRRDRDEVMPWDHLDLGVTREFLLREAEKARQALPTPDCRWRECPGCGVCPRLGVRPRLADGRPVTDAAFGKAP
ncbi:MAG: TIGR03960 family B12-binding radical SAM protein [Clostridia bacterium]|nr:TIGR03960 family B12-binding radical SAM protein [Clostridia bacterium]MDH7573585.1 TIGR03960 family B12-binding radical SAM protein [Clostridia bacterium]